MIADEPGHGRLDEADRLGHLRRDAWPGLASDLGRHLLLVEQLRQVLADQLELLAEALQVHQGRAEVVRDAVDEHLVLLGFLAELGVDRVEFLRPTLEEPGVALLPLGRLGERPGHLVEDVVEPGNLVAPADRRRQLLPLRQPVGVLGQVRDPPADVPVEEDRRGPP